ncbi:hypothetical protein ALO57_101081 [Pseudomonas coronafaciens pv. oryzae]|nr:hypothetical protein ALO57_101081 [Pseudomonas coronafaciens pv. oryzae]RMT08197.1 hypothetical protein ALP55_101708 [Pseudomonas coronafaciens pv. oryzae]
MGNAETPADTPDCPACRQFKEMSQAWQRDCWLSVERSLCRFRAQSVMRGIRRLDIPGNGGYGYVALIVSSAL